MGASITLAGESLIAQKQGAGEKLEIARFILALVPGLNPNAPVDRSAGKPPASQIKFSKVYDRKGYVSPNQVIYSLMIGSDVGDWDFNWIGLEAVGGELLAVATVPVQQKRKNIPPLQIGNNVTRNFLVEFNGAQALTGVTVDASTWQHDFTVRLNGIDLRERLSNRDVFGRACFLGDSLQIERSFGLYQLKAGIAYVEGIRIQLPEAVQINPPALPSNAWLDVSLTREGSDVVTAWKVTFVQTLRDYTDSNGIDHYAAPLAILRESGEIVDRRPTEPITGALVQEFALRTGDYENLRARATTKEDVELGNLPNEKSDDPATNSSEILATTKALNRLQQQIADAMVGMVSGFAMKVAPTGWLNCNGAVVSRTSFAGLFARIGTSYGAGDGATTFTLPDMRGLFPRGWDDGRGLDPGRVFGSFQDMLLQTHAHTASAGAVGDHTHAASTDSQGDHSHTIDLGRGEEDSRASDNRGGIQTGFADSTSTNGAHTHNVSIGGSGNHTHAVTVAAEGGRETRPKNLALLFCIKY